ncbi:hypothetical protein GDO81_028118 [Engystomops pustulosus]|uniref:Uncharacterized protein n=1 Tax=Engystomops pustulosus TaxID=76066 RepID=A0AAV6YK35_ENGPU|nr:hypothetical protein GDO81_028118 [Engystomops pustulosus]
MSMAAPSRPRAPILLCTGMVGDSWSPPLHSLKLQSTAKYMKYPGIPCWFSGLYLYKLFCAYLCYIYNMPYILPS